MSGALKPAIVHPTDFSPTSELAFAHALRLAVAMRARLDILHVEGAGESEEGPPWERFPGVRETLARWCLLPENAPQSAVRDVLGVDVTKVDLREESVVGAVGDFVHERGADLLVLGTHGREGLTRWMDGSVAERIAHRLRVPTLFVSGHASGFVEPATGALKLARVLVPVDRHPDPVPAIRRLVGILRGIDAHPRDIRLLHVGDNAPALGTGGGLVVERRDGQVVETLLEAALDADLVAMPTEGHHGFLDAMRGSTTERIVRRAPCPVLAIPVEDD